MNTVPKIIEFNPFRILGVYANSPKKELISNKGKITAFLKVSQSIEFPMDLKGILPPLSRTIESINEAESRLSIAKEQLKYIQFWFLKLTPIDDIAFNHIMAGYMDEALKIWSKQDNLSSLQNRMICYLIRDNMLLVMTHAEKLYNQYGSEYINKVDCSNTLRMTSEELVHQFLDTLSEEKDIVNLLPVIVNQEWKIYLSSKAIDPLINRIAAEVDKAKKIDHKDPKARLDAARKLVKNTNQPFKQLRGLLKESDPQYQMIADKLGIEILQCGIDYFNNSSDEDKHQTAMKMQKYAQSIVAGSLAKQRCDENVKILQKIIDELPPKEVSIYDHYIEKSLSSFINKMSNKVYPARNKLVWLKDHLTKCGPYISSIKEIVGAKNPYYLKKSTEIVDIVLAHTIEIVNSSFEGLKSSSSYGIRPSLTSIDDLRNIVKEAWQLTLMMDKFDMNPIFKQNRFLQNRSTLKNIVDQARISVGGSTSIDMRSEKQMYMDCNTITDCEHYFKIFPDGKYKNEVENKKETIRFNTCVTLKDCDSLQRDYPNRKSDIDTIRERIIYEDCDTISKCEQYLKKYPYGRFRAQVEKKIDELTKKELDKCETIDQYESFINFYHNSKYVNEAQERRDQLIQSRKRKRIIRTIILSLVILGGIGIIGYLMWSSNYQNELEKRAAKQAEFNLYDKIVNKGDSLSCARFIESYPNSTYISAVRKVLEEYEFNHLNTVDDCLDFLSKYPQSKYVSAVDSIVDERAIAIKKAMVDNSSDYDLTTLRTFVSKYADNNNNSIREAVLEVNERINQIVKEKQEKAEKARQDSIRKEEEARKRAEYEKYGTDANAWKTASSVNSISGYKEYISRYPRGKYAEAANKKIIDLEVQSIINSGDYGHLPSSQKVSYGTGKYSTINLRSRCNQTITIMYSGVKSMKIVLGAYQSRSIVLPSSTYKVVATSPGVRSFYGTENLTGGDYESEYYIETRRY